MTAQASRHAYASADPFPHIVIDGVFHEDLLDAVLAEFPKPGDIRWIEFDDARGKKLASEVDTQIGETTLFLLYQLNSSIFIDFLETVTGIEGLIPDPHFWGGGLHQIVRGGFLRIHADFNRHPRLNLDRRVNVLVYLNHDWSDSYGGHLELWNRNMTECRKQISPIFNRVVIFSTDDHSYHGHPEPLRCPEGQSRKSLALYYYSSGSHHALNPSHTSTLFRRRPGEKRFVTPEMIARALLPPVVMSWASRIRRKLSTRSRARRLDG